MGTAKHEKLFIPIGEYTRDVPGYGTSGVSSLTNYFPYNSGFISVPVPLSGDTGLTAEKFTLYTAPAPGDKYFQVNRLHFHPTQVVVTDGGVDSIYPNVGDLFIGGWNDIALREDFLGQFGTATTTNVTRTSLGNYGTDVNDPRPWCFASWSWDSVVATNYSDVPQIYYYGSVSGTFGDMITDTDGATSLRAMHVAILGKHVVLGNINFQQDDLPTPDGTNADCLKFFGDATDQYHPEMVWWSATDNETLFGDETNNPGENTGWHILNETPGSITGMCKVGDRALAIFKPGAIHLMELTGSDELFHFSIVSTNIGTIWPQSIVSVNRDIYFVSTSGRICVLRNGTSVEFVGAGKMNSFFGTFYGSEWYSAGKMPHYTAAAYSASMNSVLFQFKRAVDAGVYNTSYLLYSIESDSFGDVNGPQMTVQGAGEEFPADHPISSYTYDEDFYPVDGTLAGAKHPGIVMYDPYASFLTGTYTPAFQYIGANTTYGSTGMTKRFSFGDASIMSPPSAYIHAVRPIANTDVTSVIVRSYNSPLDSSFVVAKATGASTTSNGWFTLSGGSVSGQYFTIEWAATTSHHIIGWEVEYSLGGVRS